MLRGVRFLGFKAFGFVQVVLNSTGSLPSMRQCAEGVCDP